ncbi:MAG TPA: SIMPL domain-containing protein [Kofleriaceae bacterium]|nr:SIMPL domain-containing protein [Kofleriaceae bacterium]
MLSTPLLGCHDRVIAVTTPSDVEKPGVMTVTGSATLEVAPDCADLTMTLIADEPKPGAATQEVDAKETALIAALGKLGVTTSDLKLSTLTLEPIYDPHETWPPMNVRAYRATITVTATTHDFTQIPTIMETGANAGASAMSSLFRNSDLPGLKKKVREMALAAAKDKAQQTANALGIKLGRVISVGENAGGAMWNQPYFPQAANMEASSGGGASLGGTLQPLTLDVTIGFELSRSS